MKEKQILRKLTFIGMIALVLSIKKAGLREGLLIYGLHSSLTSFWGQIVVNKKLLSYPVRLTPNLFYTSNTFEFVLFPLLSTWNYMWTKKSSKLGILFKTLCFSIPLTLVEVWLEKKTHFIKYKNWNGFRSFWTVTAILLVIRGLAGLSRKKQVN